jgi:hydroxymethyl cephem carbamoyltransferase
VAVSRPGSLPIDFRNLESAKFCKSAAEVLVIAMKPGHDGALAAVEDHSLLYSIESEKDSWPRRFSVTSETFLRACTHTHRIPDVISVGGWFKPRIGLGARVVGAGYQGQERLRSTATFFGNDVQIFSSSHERSHIMMALGMAPPSDAPERVVLVWEGTIGRFYVVDERWQVQRQIEVLMQPGARYAFVFALADPTFSDARGYPLPQFAGKLMALAAYGNLDSPLPEAVELVDRLMDPDFRLPAAKSDFRDSALYNAGVEAQVTKDAGVLITQRIFDVFAEVAERELPRDVPLVISGGCGLNCDWNHRWRETGQFSSVFVPPCTDDSGSAVGTAIDALVTTTDEPRPIEWTVYSGLEFDWDRDPDPDRWTRQPRDNANLAGALANGRVVAWVQGKWEIGPRALGNRSILAEPFSPATKDRLNQIKQREDYRPIAPMCRAEDVGTYFTDDFEDPFMLFFRLVKADNLGAVTHVDGSARVQTVRPDQNKQVHDLLTAFAERTGTPVLCNTSLNLPGCGFINSMTDLVGYCEQRGIDDMVVGDAWFTRVRD